MTKRIALVGASGFVGTAVAIALDAFEVVVVPAPRLSTDARTLDELRAAADCSPQVWELAQVLRGVEVLVNAAGNPDASSLNETSLFGANALLPGVLLRAARDAGVRRFVHVSSAVVQSDKPVLDSSEDLRPFSPYSASKCAGEQLLRDMVSGLEVVRYRPPSVHETHRRVTRMVRRIATSRAATVARPGHQPTPQALLPNVASAIAYLATCEPPVPAVVHHPWEGVTVSSLMEDLSGGRRPVRLPRLLATSVIRAGKVAGRWHKPTAANARRVELLWVGQTQAVSWLTSNGWSAPVGREGWRAMAQANEA